MIFNRYQKIYRIRQLVIFRCNEMCSSPGICASEAGAKVSRKTVGKGVSKKELRDGEMAVAGGSILAAKDGSIGKEGGVENTPIQLKKTETIVKEEVSKKEAEASKKEGGLVMDDFLIRNIMTFPLHATVEKTEPSNENELQVKKFPSVTSILQETMPPDTRKRLELWKQKMIEMMGPEKFMSYQNDSHNKGEETLIIYVSIDPVEKLRTKKLSLKHKRSKKIVIATLNRGTRLHSALKSYLLGEDMEKIPIHKEVEGCWKSVKTILPDISDVKVVESDIFHPHLQYKGIVDCVASYKNTPHVIEWKQSEKVKKDLSSTFDAPIQLTAYMGALSWCKKVDLPSPITCGLVVVAYCDGAPADVFQMDSNFCQSYWEQWLRRVQRFWATRSPNLQPPGC